MIKTVRTLVLFALLFVFAFKSLTAQCLSGTYFIGEGDNPDYSTISAFVDDLSSNGICGPILARLYEGVYEEQVVIPEISGASFSNTISFIKAEDVPFDGVILRWPATTTPGDDYIVHLQGSDYVTFSGLRFERTAADVEHTFASAVKFSLGATNNTFQFNRVFLPQKQSSVDLWAKAIYTIDDGNAYTTISQNTFVYGSEGISWLQPGIGAEDEGIYIIDNYFGEQSDRAIWLRRTDSSVIEGNEIKSPAFSAASNFTGVALDHCIGALRVERNHMQRPQRHNVRKGLSMNECDGQTSSILVANNIWWARRSTVDAIGAELSSVRKVDFLHNTVISQGPRGVYVTNPRNVRSFNNNIQAGYGYYFESEQDWVGLQSDYNNLYGIGAAVRIANGQEFSTITDWVLSSGQDAHSFRKEVVFADVHGWQVEPDVDLDAGGIGFVEVPEDWEGNLRDALRPDVGVNEFDLPENDAAVLDFILPGLICPSLQPVRLVLRNTGSGPVTSMNVEWSINGEAQNTYHWSGTLLSGEQTTPTIGLVAASGISDYELEARVAQVNMIDDIPTPGISNSLATLLQTQLTGTYSIAKFGGDFESFAEATAALNERGTCGDVLFEVGPGIYEERFQIEDFPKDNPADQVTFMAANESSNSVIIKIDGFINSPNKLIGAKNIVFQHLTFERTGGQEVFELENIENIHFEHCQFYIEDGTVLLLSGTANGLTVHDNDMNFNVSALLIEGTQARQNLVFTNNRLEKRPNNLDSKALKIWYTDQVTVSNNEIRGGGVQTFQCDSLSIQNNFIFSPNEALDLQTGQYATVYNNVLVKESEDILPTFSTFNLFPLYIYHNTVVGYSDNFHGTLDLFIDADDYPFADTSYLRNNIIVNQGTWVSLDLNTNRFNSQHNVFFSNDTFAIRNIDFIYTLEQWQLQGNDSLSLFALPNFANIDYEIADDPTIAQSGTTLPSPTRDIHGELRNDPPDPGADEFSNYSYDAAIVYVTQQEDNCQGTPEVETRMANFGPDTLRRAVIQWQVNDSLQSPYYWSGTLAPGDTSDLVRLGRYLFAYESNDMAIWTAVPGDSNADNDTLALNGFTQRMGGTYSTGSSDALFFTPIEAVAALHKMGACAAITFELAPGNYEGQILLEPYPGFSEINRLSMVGAGNGQVTMSTQFGSISILKLNGLDHFSISDVTLFKPSASPGSARAIEFAGGSDYLTIENCVIYGNIVSDQEVDHFTTIRNNRFNKSRILLGVAFLEEEFEQGLIFENNTFESGSGNFHHFRKQEGALIKNNFFPATHEVVLENVQAMTFEGNQLAGGTGPAPLSIHSAEDPLQRSNRVVNNFIGSNSLTAGFSTPRGIGLSGTNVEILHNTLLLSGSNGFGISMASSFNDVSGLRIENNIIVARSDIRLYEMGTILPTNASIDYNVIYTTDDFVANIEDQGFGSNISWEDWQFELGYDQESQFVNPRFLADEVQANAPSDLHLSPNWVQNLNVPNPLLFVSDDIDGAARNPLNPTAGAHEFPTQAFNAAPLAINPGFDNVCSGDNELIIRIGNFGTEVLNSLTINWEINGAIQAPFAWTGVLAPNGNTEVNIGTFNFPAEADYTLRTWTSEPNGQVDMFSALDTISQTTSPGLQGVYIVGDINGDFETLEAAVEALNSRGVCGPVTLNIEDGIYEGQVLLGEIKGTGPETWVTIQSESQDKDAVTLQFFNENQTGPQHVLMNLNSTSYFQFRHLTFKALNPNLNFLVSCSAGAHHLTFESNRFLGQPNTINTASPFLVSIGNPAYESGLGIAFINNDFEFGSNALNISGGTGIQTAAENNLLIQGNRFIGQNNEPAIRINGPGWGIRLLENEFDSEIRALQFTEINGDFEIARNVFKGGGYSAIFMESCFVPEGRKGQIHHNIMVPKSADVNPQKMLWINFSSNIDIAFNTIQSAFAETIFPTTGIYISNSEEISLYNNLVYAPTAGLGFEFLNTEFIQCDYNNVFLDAGSTFIDWNGTNISDLTAWRNLGFGLHSTSLDPMFPTIDSLRPTNPGLNNTGLFLPAFLFDIEGVGRLNPPDIGVYESDGPTLDLALIEVVAPTAFAPGENNLVIEMRNTGQETIVGAEILWSVGGQTTQSYQWTGNLAAGDVVEQLDLGTYEVHTADAYDIAVWINQVNAAMDENSLNDSLHVSIAGALPLAGAYIIGASGAADFPSFTAAVEALEFLGVSNVVVFEVEPGFYQENIVIPAIPSMNSAHNVTFKSITLEANQVTLSSQGITTVVLDDADYFTFEYLTLEVRGDEDNLNVFKLQGDVSNFTLNRCILHNYNESGEPGFSGIVEATGTGLYAQHHYQNNEFWGGLAGLYYAAENESTQEVFVHDNTFNGQRAQAIFLANLYDFTALNNVALSHNTFNGEGIRMQSIGGEINISENFLTVFTQPITLSELEPDAVLILTNNQFRFRAGIGLRLESIESGEYVVVANNFVFANDLAADVQAIHLSDVHGMQLLYNSIDLQGNGAIRADGIALLNGASGNTILNNVVQSRLLQGDLLQTASGTMNNSTNHNDFYNTSGSFALTWEGETYSSLEEFRNATGQCQNCLSVDPLFQSDNNLHLLPGSPLIGAGIPTPFINYDINLEERDPLAPTIGADERMAEPDNLDLVALALNGSGVEPPFNGEVVFTVQNNGAETVASAEAFLSINGTIEAVTELEFPIEPGGETELYLGEISLNQAIDNEIKAWTNAPNGLPDSNPENDTITVFIEATNEGPLVGIYSVGTGGDFATLGLATAALQVRGISGDVTFELLPQTFEEQIYLEPFPGMGGANQLIFTSRDSLGERATIQAFAATENDNYVITLDRVENVVWSHLDINVSADNPELGRVIHIINNCKDIWMEHCNLEGTTLVDPFGTGASSLIHLEGVDAINGFLLRKNNLLRGSWNVYFNNAGEEATVISGLITGNQFLGSIFGGIRFAGIHNFEIVDNHIETNQPDVDGWIGLWVREAAGPIGIDRNRVISSVPVVMGIWLFDVTGPITTVSNNFVSIETIVSSKAIYALNCFEVDFYYNTAHISSQANGVTHAAFEAENCEALNLLNNVFSNYSGGFSVIGTGLNDFSDFNYNLLHSTATNPIYWEGQGIGYDAWIMDQGFGNNNLFADPLLISDVMPYVANDSPLESRGTPIVGYLVDIDNEQRNPVTPDIGADEFDGGQVLSDVYPGDCNDDDTANTLDLLHLGVAIPNNYTGPARPDASLEWMGQPASDWSVDILNVNAKHSDTDGNGIINVADTSGIFTNLGQVHGLWRPEVDDRGPDGPSLYFELPAEVVPVGTEMAIPVFLGTEDDPALNFYGISFQIAYSDLFVEPGSVSLVFEDSSWIGGPMEVLATSIDFPTEAYVEGGTVRFNGQNVNGYGQIATLYLTVATGNSGAMMLQPIILSAISSDGSPVEIGVLEGVVDVITSSYEVGKEGTIRLAPNPCDGESCGIIATKDLDQSTLILRDVLGREVQRFTTAIWEGFNAFSFDGIPAGLYYLEVRSEQRVWQLEMSVVW